MSIIQVANVNFESTANNQLVYSANTLTIRTGGASIMVANSTAINVVSNTFNLGVSSITANGYSRLPNGLLLQWGNDSRTVNATTTNTSTFPIAFTALYSVSVVSRDTGIAAANATITVTALGTTTFTWRNYGTGAAAASSIYYYAIGI